MEIKKTINGYSIEVDKTEYQTLVDALYYGERYWQRYDFLPDVGKFSDMYDEFIKARDRFLTDEEAKPVINCLTCKNCLPPFQRKNGRMCKVEKCDFNPA